MIGFEVSSFLPTLLDINSFCPTLTSISRRFKEGATNIHGYSASKWRRGGVPVHRICLEGRHPRRPDQSRHRRERDGSADLYAVAIPADTAGFTASSAPAVLTNEIISSMVRWRHPCLMARWAA